MRERGCHGRSLKAGCTLVLGLLLTVAAASALEGQEVVYAEIAPGVGASVELGGTGGFAETVYYSVFFFSDASSLITSVTLPGNVVADRPVLSISGRGQATTPSVEQCRLIDGFPVCQPLDAPARFEIAENGDGLGEFLEIELPEQDIDWDQGFLRLRLVEGQYELAEMTADGTLRNARSSPALIDVVLPTLSDLEQQYLSQRPFLRVDATPLLRGHGNEGGGFDDLGLSFSGGLYRVVGGGSTRAQVTWEGAVATSDSLAFNHLSLGAGIARNLWPGDWLPVTFSVLGTSDQGFDAFDLSASASLTFVLPFNLNLQSGEYRPAIAPRLTLLGEWGTALERDLPELEERFLRGGYEVRWRLPIGESELLRFRHAGLWNDPVGAERDFHALWDIQVDIALGGATYFIGYQKGEAAPLFERIETTRLGFSFAVSDPTTPRP